MSDFLNKQWHEMSDAQLIASHKYWTEEVMTAPGWSSAYFAAMQLEGCQRESDKRGLGLRNKYRLGRTP